MSDVKAPEAVAPQAGLPETTPATDAAVQQTSADAVAPTEGAPVAAPAAAPAVDANKTATNGTSKPNTEKTNGAAGHKEKNLLQKMMFWKKDKKAETAAATS